MKLLSLLRDQVWQGIGAIIALITALAIPEVRVVLFRYYTFVIIAIFVILWTMHDIRNYVISNLRNLDWKSFIVGLVAGGLFVSLTVWFLPPTLYASRITSTNKPQVRMYESDTMKPEILEGSHYKLKSDTNYKIEVMNPEKTDELIWLLVPENFGKINYKLNQEPLSSISAEFITPKVQDEQGGIIKICELDESSQCRALNLPEIKVVVEPN